MRRAVITIGLLLASAASAQSERVGPKTIPGETREQKLFVIADKLKAMDTNQDGRLTAAEWTAGGGTKAGFDTLDYNKDGILTRQELRSNARKLRAFEDFMAAPAT